MDRWVGKVAVVTGASSGIGAAIADSLVNAGVIVAGVARRSNLIEENAKKLEGKPGKLHAVQADLTKEEDVIKAFDHIKTKIGAIHILVNNAGILNPTTSLRKGDSQVWKSILDVNVLGLSVATREAYKSMEESNVDGHIIHINSTAGHELSLLPSNNMYSPSKFAVTALAETLRKELDILKSWIKITSLSPGLVDTALFNKVSDVPEVERILKSRHSLVPQDIADAAIYILSTPPRVQIQELTIKPHNFPKE